jgi:hypothetical protein
MSNHSLLLLAGRDLSLGGTSDLLSAALDLLLGLATVLGLDDDLLLFYNRN